MATFQDTALALSPEAREEALQFISVSETSKSINAIADSIVRGAMDNASLNYDSVRIMKANELLALINAKKAPKLPKPLQTTMNSKTEPVYTAAKRGMLRKDPEVMTQIEFLEKWADRDVILWSQNIVNNRSPDYETKSKQTLLKELGVFDHKLGMTLKFDQAVRDKFKYKQLAINMMLTVSDACTATCRNVLNHIKLEKEFGHCVQAMDEDGNAVDLQVSYVALMRRYTFWNPRTFDDSALKHFKTIPMISQHQKLVTYEGGKPISFSSVPQFVSFPQLCFYNGAPPVHWMMMMVAHNDTDVFIVFMDPTYAQFNPNGVLDGYLEMRRKMPDYKAQFCGAPKAFCVGKLNQRMTDTSQDFSEKLVNQAKEWIKRNGGINLDGTTFGCLKDYKFCKIRTPMGERTEEVTLPVRALITGIKDPKFQHYNNNMCTIDKIVKSKRDDSTRYGVQINNAECTQVPAVRSDAVKIIGSCTPPVKDDAGKFVFT
tara:strand:+ start:211 stop:1674 length:1464 start_codon:yes stop_codon:yes gene_type:complete